MKLLKKCLAILLSFCLLVNVGVFLGKDKNNAQASTDGPYLDSFMAYYFYNLESTFPNNKAGTCGYVAVGMVLSYYDNFLNANIIPEKYEGLFKGVNSNIDNDFTNSGKSPGVKSAVSVSVAERNKDLFVEVDMPEIYNGTDYELDYKAYYENMLAVLDNATSEDANDVLLQSKLFQLEKERDYFSSLRWEDYTSTSGGLTNIQVGNLFYYYLSELGLERVETKDDDGNVISLLPGQFRDRSCFNLAGENVKIKIREYIDFNIPVILGISSEAGANGKKRLHYVVAYDYDDDGNIYCHFGWGSDEKHITIESEGYVNIDTYITLEINTPHVCDDNYIYNGVGYCYHNEEINTYNHTHYFTNGIDYENIDGVLYHTIQCEDCFETRENQTNHCHTMCEYISQSEHKATCICGDYIYKPHSVKLSEIYTDARGRRVGSCTGCGFAIIISNSGGGGITEMEPWAVGTIKYSVNGSQMLPNGLVILVDEDVKAYNLGTLQFYNENDLEMSVL